MSRKFNGSSDRASITVDLSSFSKLTLAFWLWVDAFSTGDETALCYDIGNGSNGFQLDCGWNATKVGFGFYTAASNRWVELYTKPSGAAWHHYVWAPDRAGPTNTLYIDGAVTSPSSSIHDAATYGNFSNSALDIMVQQSAPSTFIRFLAGRMAELAIWPGVTLTASEALALSKGATPQLVHPDGLTVYVPMLGDSSPEPDYGGTKKSATLTGTTVANHPGVRSLLMGFPARSVTKSPIPVNTVAPAVTGTAAVGSTLSCTTGTWTNSGTPAYTYQWQRGGVNIGAATAATYVLVDADDATSVRCVVTNTDAEGAVAANSNAVAITEPVPTNSVAPVASGTVHVGDTVSATTGTWTHQGGTIATYAYQWQDSADGSTGWANIAAATASSYAIAAGELDKYLRCNVTATNSGGPSAAATASNVLGPVIAAVVAASNRGSGAAAAAFIMLHHQGRH